MDYILLILMVLWTVSLLTAVMLGWWLCWRSTVREPVFPKEYGQLPETTDDNENDAELPDDLDDEERELRRMEDSLV
jgi:hypothetical protein